MNVYDFDGTIYAGDSTIDFYLFALKTRPSIARFWFRQMFGICGYLLKRLSKTQMKEFFFSFLSGIETQNLVERFWAEKQDKVYSWYLKKHEKDDIVISASPEFLLRPICDHLGIDRLIASQVDYRTGVFIGNNCYGKEKVNRLYEETGIKHFDCFFSDSVSDLPLAELSEYAYLVRKGAVKEWKIQKQ